MLSTPTFGGSRLRLWCASFAEASWQTRQSRRKGVCPAATCSFYDRVLNLMAPFIGPSCSDVAIALIKSGGHLDRALDSSQIWFFDFPSTSLGTPRRPGRGTSRGKLPPTVVGLVAGAANSDWLKVWVVKV